MITKTYPSGRTVTRYEPGDVEPGDTVVSIYARFTAISSDERGVTCASWPGDAFIRWHDVKNVIKKGSNA